MNYEREIKELIKRQENVDKQLVELGENLQRLLPLLAQTIMQSQCNNEEDDDEDSETEDDSEDGQNQYEVLQSDIKIIEVNDELDLVRFSCKVELKNKTDKTLNVQYRVALKDSNKNEVGETFQIVVLDPYQQLIHSASEVFSDVSKAGDIDSFTIQASLAPSFPL